MSDPFSEEEDGDGEHIVVTVDLTGPFDEMVSQLQRISFLLEELTSHIVKGNEGPKL
jgi:hypothetical protein